MDNPKYSVIYCSICESDKISLDQMKCMNCGNPFTDDDIQDLLKEAHQDHLKDLEAAVRFTDNLARQLINGEGDKEPVGLFGTISFDKGRPPGVSIGKLESVETLEGVQGGLIKHLKFRQNGNDCIKCKHSFIDVHFGQSCKRFDAFLKCNYEEREGE